MSYFKSNFPFAGEIQVSESVSAKEPFPHQIDAFHALDEIFKQTGGNYLAGLLVLPTGGGKTYTAASWILKNKVDKKCKILWIAHRHALLEQACEAFKKMAYRDILRSTDKFKFRILSGVHDRPVNIKNSDDIVIASKDSLTKGFDHLLYKWIKPNNMEEIFVVIDEAHHATAKSYRTLIKKIRAEISHVSILGLTATPFRTAENEQGLLGKLFHNDIIYKIDLSSLVSRGILSEPIFEDFETSFDMTKVISDDDFSKIQKFDIEQIGKETARSIAENSERNNFIVNTYVRNREKYKQTLVFALNVDNAIALNALFKAKGIKSDFIVSNIRDIATGALTSSKENVEKIEKFKNLHLEVLVNVNILTEGTDLPNVQTIFLARPTKSAILMTQMIGRGLRGLQAGGTKDAYIVSFIDEWKNKISWINPEKLFIDENTNFDDKTKENKKRLIRLISIDKIEEFARLADKSIDTSNLEGVPFLTRIPVGIYLFEIPRKTNKYVSDFKKVEILVFDNLAEQFTEFINQLPALFSEFGFNEKEELTQNEIMGLSSEAETYFFAEVIDEIGFRKEDLCNIIEFYSMYEVPPKFIEFTDRSLYDIDKIAREIYDLELGGAKKQEYINSIWEESSLEWKTFFGYNKKFFRQEIDLSIRKIEDPEAYSLQNIAPKIIIEAREHSKFTMYELKNIDYKYYSYLWNSVFKKSMDENGLYTCAISGYKNKNKIFFQIDHIVPMSEGGLTVLENLQLLKRSENQKKGNNILPPNKDVFEQQELELAELAQILVEKPNNFEVINKRATIFRKIERFNDAAEEYSKAIDLRRNDSSLYSGRAFCKAESGSIEDAIKDATKALDIDDNNAEAYAVRGGCYNELDRLQEAAADLQKSIEINGDNPISHLDYGINLFKQNKYTSALNYFNSAISINESFESAYIWMGSCYLNLKNYKVAVTNYKRALKINNENDDTFYMLGEAYEIQKKYRQAIDYYDRALAINQTNYEAFFRKGYCYGKLGNIDEAIFNYLKTLEVNDNHYWAYICLGNEYTTKRKYLEAIEYYNKALSIEPNDTSIYFHIAWANSKLKRRQTSIDNYLKYLKFEPDDISALINLGIEYYQIKDFTKALYFQDKVITLSPKIRYWDFMLRGDTFIKLQNLEAAQKDFSKAIEIRPNSKAAKIKLQKIKTLLEGT